MIDVFLTHRGWVRTKGWRRVEIRATGEVDQLDQEAP